MHYCKPHLHSCLFSRFRYCCTTCSINPYPSLSWRRIHSISQLTSNSTDPRPPKHRQFFFLYKVNGSAGSREETVSIPLHLSCSVKGLRKGSPRLRPGEELRANVSSETRMQHHLFQILHLSHWCPDTHKHTTRGCCFEMHAGMSASGMTAPLNLSSVIPEPEATCS